MGDFVCVSEAVLIRWGQNASHLKWSKKKMESGGLDWLEQSSYLPTGPASLGEACHWPERSIKVIEDRVPDGWVSIIVNSSSSVSKNLQS